MRSDATVDAGDGLTLHVERAGRGAPLLLLHGFTGSAETWASLADALGDDVATIAVDLPGHGRSSAPADPARYAIARTADDLARVLDALGVERAAVLGYSMGGRVALRFALRHPDRVSALVLESASPGIADAGERAARVRADGELADAIERDGVEAFVERWERLPLWESQQALPVPVREQLRAQRLRNRGTGLANSLRRAGAGAEPDVRAELGMLRMPVLLIAGALDTKYAALARAMAAEIPGARAEIVPDAGHAVHLERPEAFAGIVAAFLGTAPMGRSPANLIT